MRSVRTYPRFIISNEPSFARIMNSWQRKNKRKDSKSSIIIKSK